MNKNLPGCLTPSALIATLLTLTVIGIFALTGGNQLFSSGALNAQIGQSIGGVTSHAELVKDCGKCHTAPWDAESMDDHCTACHQDIATQVADGNSMHGNLMKNRSVPCRECHSDHNGANAPLTMVDVSAFPHQLTGFSLASHKKQENGLPFACADCHNGDLSRFDPTLCQTCHKQINSAFMQGHIQTFSVGCMDCHDGLETLNKKYNHNLTKFKLEGQHLGLDCATCHAGARTAADFTSTSPECATCHRQDDAHAGKFGTACEMCHNASAWQPASFDHNLTTFRLDGAHSEAECEACHINSVFKGTPSTCISCHQKEDEHNGKFGQNCQNCHSTTAWTPATFDHNLSTFKLLGAHINVACEACHKNNVFQGTPQTCAACHAEPAFHAGLFPAQGCDTCHNANAWSPALFNQPHPQPLTDEGGSGIQHGGATCRQCHPSNLNSFTCLACHDSNNPDGEGGGDD